MEADDVVFAEVVATLYFDEPELNGSRLTGAQAKETIALSHRFAELSPAEREQLERLVGIAAGDEQLFAKRREHAAAKQKIDTLTEEARMASVPVRPMYEEPGSMTLPVFVFKWLATAKDAEWTVADTGALVAVLGMFHSRKSLIPRRPFRGRCARRPPRTSSSHAP